MTAEFVPLNRDYDVVIVGGGPAGASLAINLAGKNHDVLIVEKSEFPRFHIGESLSGESADLLCELGLQKEMETSGYLVKHGVFVQGPSENSKFWVPVQRIAEDGEIESRTTWQVRRSEFDKMLLDTARERGSTLVNADALNVTQDGDRVTGIELKLQDGTKVEVKSKIVVDASGQSCFLGKRNLLGPRVRAGYEKQIAIFAHLKGVQRDPVPKDTNTHIFYGDTDHWAWLIPIDEQVTSIGIVVPIEKFKSSKLGLDDFFTKCFQTINPHLMSRLEGVEVISDVRAVSNYSYDFNQLAGPGYMCVGDSHGFLDPIFSFGVNVALKEGMLAADEIEKYLRNGLNHSFEAYSRNVKAAHGIVRLVVDTFWKYPLAFLRLAHYSHKNEIAQLFSGRFFDSDVHSLDAVKLMQELLEKGKSA